MVAAFVLLRISAKIGIEAVFIVASVQALTRVGHYLVTAIATNFAVNYASSEDHLRTSYLRVSMIIGVLSGVVSTAAYIVLADLILGVVAAPEGLRHELHRYLVVSVVAIPFDQVSQIAFVSMRVRERAAEAGWIATVVVAVKVVTSWVVGIHFGYGVVGIAVGSVCGSVTGAFWSVSRSRIITDLSLSTAAEESVRRLTVRRGWPILADEISGPVSTLLLFSLVLWPGGLGPPAVFQIITRIGLLCALPIRSIASGALIVAGILKRDGEEQSVAIVSVRIASLVALPITLMLILFPDIVVSGVVGGNELVGQVTPYLWLFAVAYVFSIPVIVFGEVLRGLGSTGIVSLVNSLCRPGIRLLVSVLAFSLTDSVSAIMLATVAETFVGAVLMSFFWYRYRAGRLPSVNRQA